MGSIPVEESDFFIVVALANKIFVIYNCKAVAH